ncbi:hypothetical protein [Georgenia yuyongxinii]
MPSSSGRPHRRGPTQGETHAQIDLPNRRGDRHERTRHDRPGRTGTGRTLRRPAAGSRQSQQSGRRHHHRADQRLRGRRHLLPALRACLRRRDRGGHAGLRLRAGGRARRRRGRRQPRPGVRPQQGRRVRPVRRTGPRRLRPDPGADRLPRERARQPDRPGQRGPLRPDGRRRPGRPGQRLPRHAGLQRPGRELLRLRRRHVHGRLLRAGLHGLARHERHRRGRVRLGQPGGREPVGRAVGRRRPRQRPSRALRGRHRPRARAPAHELLRPGRAVLGGRGARGHGRVPQRLRHDRQPPHLPAGVPPGDLADPVGRRPGELRRLVQLLRLPVGAGRRQRRRRPHPGPGVRRRRRRPARQADLRRAGGLHRGRAERHRCVQRPDRRRAALRRGAVPGLGRDDVPRRRGLQRVGPGQLRPRPHVGRLDHRSRQQLFFDGRGSYQGAQPNAKFDKLPNRPDSTALPFGVSYEKFRNPGPRVSLQFDGEDTSRVAPRSGDSHWWGGYASQSDTVLSLDTPVTGGETVSFWTWYFIEEGWDYGFVEALVDGEWVTLPVTDVASGAVVSTNEDPHSNNTEGNGITGTSGGTYFVDEPQYVQYQVTVPDGGTDLRWRYSTDAAYLDTGWFIDDVTVDGTDAVLFSEEGNWIQTNGEQDNDWTVQVIAACDLTPGTASAGEIVDDAGNYVYRFTGDEISTYPLSTNCANGPNTDFVVSVSNLPSGDLAVLDAGYDYSVVKTKK